MNSAYKKTPINLSDDIPVFSQQDFYVENYDRISGDHLSHFERTGHNPFMPEDLWLEIESSTENLIQKYVDRIASKPVRILDVGVGMGRLLARFPLLERYGMDISLGYLKYANSKGIDVCLSKIEDMPYQDNYFDIVVCTDVLEHVLDLNLAIRNILSTLKEGGIFIVRVPYREELSAYLQENYPYDLAHLRNFDENSLKILFEKIFRMNFLEYGFTGYLGSQLSGEIKLRCVNGLVTRCLSLIRKISRPLCLSLSRRVCKPVDINVVVGKPCQPN